MSFYIGSYVRKPTSRSFSIAAFLAPFTSPNGIRLRVFEVFSGSPHSYFEKRFKKRVVSV